MQWTVLWVLVAVVRPARLLTLALSYPCEGRRRLERDWSSPVAVAVFLSNSCLLSRDYRWRQWEQPRLKNFETESRRKVKLRRARLVASAAERRSMGKAPQSA